MMNWTGKVIGFIIGLILGSPFTIMLGLLIGHLFDIGVLHKWFGGPRHFDQFQQAGRVQTIFFNSTFLVMGYVAKSDGRVSENEIRTARAVMQQMDLDENMRRQAMHLFNQGKESNFDLNQTLAELRQACWRNPNLLRMFLEIQIQMAYADNQVISLNKRQTLQHICQQLGVGGINFSQFEDRFRAEQDYQRYQRKTAADPNQGLNDAYQILGVSANDSFIEIKKRYRRLMSQNHPDKLIAKGLPPEMIKVATKKTQQIKKAFEQIREARGEK